MSRTQLEEDKEAKRNMYALNRLLDLAELDQRIRQGGGDE